MRLGQPRRTEHDVVVPRHAEGPLHAGANRIAHQAAATVATSKKVCFDLVFHAGFKIADDRQHGRLVLFEPDQFAVQPHFDAGQRVKVLAHDFFDGVLRNPLRMLGIQRIAARRAIQGIVETRQQVAGHARRENNMGRVVNAERRSIAQGISNAPAPEMLTRPDVGCFGARRHADARIFLYHQAVDAAAAELYGQALSGRPGSDDEDLSVLTHGFHLNLRWRRCASPCKRRRWFRC